MKFDPLNLFNFIIPTEETPEKLRVWRVKVAFLFLLAFFLISILPFLAENRYANAQEADKVHQEITKELSGVKGEIRKLNESYTKSEEERKEQERLRAIRDLRTQLYQTQKEACLQSGRLRDVLMQTLEELRSDFMLLTGSEYPTLSCGNFRDE
jgi:Skp family chaperone for outer membrane proteins